MHHILSKVSGPSSNYIYQTCPIYSMLHVVVVVVVVVVVDNYSHIEVDYDYYYYDY